MTDGKTRYADDATLEYIAKLEAELAEWKLRALTAESMEEDAQQAAAKFKAERDHVQNELQIAIAPQPIRERVMREKCEHLRAERDKLRVLLLRADEALSMAIDIDDPHLSPSERDWIITQARGTHSDITAALQEAGS